MKRNKRRSTVPQYEFRFAADTFNLEQQTALDGERITRERAEAERAARLADAALTHLFTLNASDDETRKS